jgi:hypothetical protein
MCESERQRAHLRTVALQPSLASRAAAEVNQEKRPIHLSTLLVAVKLSQFDVRGLSGRTAVTLTGCQ